MTSYKDTAKKQKMWMEKAAEVGKPVGTPVSEAGLAGSRRRSLVMGMQR